MVPGWANGEHQSLRFECRGVFFFFFFPFALILFCLEIKVEEKNRTLNS